MASICQGKSKKRKILYITKIKIYIYEISYVTILYIYLTCACMYIKYYTMITILYFENLKAGKLLFLKKEHKREATSTQLHKINLYIRGVWLKSAKNIPGAVVCRRN